MASTKSIFMIFLLIAVAYAQKSLTAFEADVDIPEGCQKLTIDSERSKDDKYYFCPDKPDNYPQEEVDSFVKSLEKLASSEEIEDYVEQPDDAYVLDPSCPKEKHKNCCTESKREQPYFVNSEDKMKLVIQSKFFQQIITKTKCAHESMSCFEDLKLGDFGYKTKCVTNYGTTKILVYNSETKQTETVPASFPVSCSCVISKD